jgi:hypothetical protein
MGSLGKTAIVQEFPAIFMQTGKSRKTAVFLISWRVIGGNPAEKTAQLQEFGSRREKSRLKTA